MDEHVTHERHVKATRSQAAVFDPRPHDIHLPAQVNLSDQGARRARRLFGVSHASNPPERADPLA
jgi:hypothetical protein